MNTPSGGDSTVDAFSRFWTEAMSRAMGGGGWPSQSPPRDDLMRQMRQAFLDAWEHHCIELMSSEAFLELMRKSMDNALAFKGQMNQLLAKILEDSPIPSRDDTDSILQVLRSIEGRVLDRLDRLTERVDEIEERQDHAPARPPGPAKRKSK